VKHQADAAEPKKEASEFEQGAKEHEGRAERVDGSLNFEPSCDPFGLNTQRLLRDLKWRHTAVRSAPQLQRSLERRSR
jgi:hypothetical protein